MHTIATFTLRDTDINIMYNDGQLAFTFDYDGKSYGQKVTLQSKKILDIVSASFLLFTNALETREKLDEDNRLREGTQTA